MGQQIEVLYFIDDTDDEAFLTKLLFDVERIDLKLEHFTCLSDFKNAYHQKGDNEAALLVVDLNMPKQNGIEVVGELKEDSKYRNITAGICTGSEDPEDRRGAQTAGAEFFIQKPLDKRSLQKICQLVPKLNINMNENGSVQIELN